MIKFIKYHLLYLFNDLWMLLLVIISLVSGFLFYYLGNGFDSSLLRVLEKVNYLKEFKTEAFLVTNLILSIWIIGASKELFIIDDPHILVINKKKYIKSKIIAYLLYYYFVSVLIYGNYQIIVYLLYGVIKYDYSFITHLLLNVTLVHLIVVSFSGKNKNILVTMIFILIYLIFNSILEYEFYLKGILYFFIPYLNLGYPYYGYIHNVLLFLMLYYISSYKHISFYE